MSRREPQGQPSVTTAALTGVADPNIRQAVREVLENVSCSDVQPVYAGESVQLQGYVSSEAARDTITREVKALVGAGARYEALEVIEPPFCSHLELAEADGAHNGPIIRLNKEDGVYRDGDYLVVTMLAPPEQDGYLRVDFIDTDGTVVHMLPSRYNSNNAIDRGNVIQLGVADRRLTGDAYELTAPFGRAMIVAHWSESPILSAPRPEVEPSAPYLAALSEAISTNATDYRREHVFIEIHPRQD